MKRFAIAGCIASLLVIAVGLTFVLARGNRMNLEGIDCVVHPRVPVAPETSHEYKGGRIYFCCFGCPGVFDNDPSKFTTRANRQLVATLQTRQHKCPLCGGDLEPKTTIVLTGARVVFCGAKCSQQVEKLKDEEEQLELVFGEEAFQRGEFRVGRK